MMWEVIFVDRATNEFANNIVRRAADPAGVPSRQRIALRQRIAADSDVGRDSSRAKARGLSFEVKMAKSAAAKWPGRM
jgi:hypothetical protein